MARYLVGDVKKAAFGDIANPLAILSEREQQVAALVGKGLSNKLIARTLGVAEGTIKCHLHAIFLKLGIQSRFELFVVLDRTRSV